MVTETRISLDAAAAAIQAASAAHGPIRVHLSGLPADTWHPAAIRELLDDAEAIYWSEPPPGLPGYELTIEMGSTVYRIEVARPAGAAQ